MVCAAALFACAGRADSLYPGVEKIFRQHCVECHGPDKQKSAYRLDRRDEAFRGGDSAETAIVAGHPEKSALWKRVTGQGDERMPPKGPALSVTELETLRAWMASGAPWPAATAGASPGKHWAFLPVRRPGVPVETSRWVRNPIDSYVLAGLRAARLSPSPEAERAVLVRRVSLDLLGLLPPPREIEAVLRDRRGDWYERYVDHCLASVHFGERWGRHWLDLARYADSDGYQIDTVRPFAWVYRDWVINAVNRDMPFDQFTVEQLAGDLLPGAIVDQKIATGFHRNSLRNNEDGVDREEFRCKAMVDRVSTTGTAWLGLTLGCAECHSHKYDPVSQREFYQMFAFFNPTRDVDLPAGESAVGAVFLERRAQWERETARLSKKLADREKELNGRQAAWEKAQQPGDIVWQPLVPASARSVEGGSVAVGAAGWVSATGRLPATDAHLVVLTNIPPGTTGLRVEIIPEPSRKKKGGSPEICLTEISAQLALAGGGEVLVKIARAVADQEAVDAKAAMVIDGRASTGWRVGHSVKERHLLVLQWQEPLRAPAGSALTLRLEQRSGFRNMPGKYRISSTVFPGLLRADPLPDAVMAALRLEVGKRTPAQQLEVAQAHRQTDPEWRATAAALEALKEEEPKGKELRAQTLAVAEKAPVTHIHIRGDFLRHGDAVEPGIPAVLNPLARRRADVPPDRLDLARWLVSRENPLTARVAVNQFWLRLFGRGIVNTPEDFGLRGEKPSHPELLDWLADEFVERGWSRKAILRLIVTSSTYRQASARRGELDVADPENRLMGRQNRLRVDAEIVRDLHLSAAGLLDPSVGGPGFYPELSPDVAAAAAFSHIKWVPTEGPERRRSIYIMMHRTVQFPMLATFNGADANVACARRERSNTPLQALTLLNNPAFVEAAQALGAQMMSHPGPVQARIEHGFRRCLVREPSRAEGSRLMRLWKSQCEAGRGHSREMADYGGEAAAQGDTAEAAGYTGIAQMLLNLDEFLTRE